ncbi:hypothetical protein E8E12_011147 [Didymella heteroderae]|uniref:ribonuclease T1 n=1 Tax=Didymella heteroderae TaxID=1769908 RepID=A0A9P4X0K5_9PLEO|nr:hypothetical protein E8E12_011147 [Didymella heteroderae]
MHLTQLFVPLAVAGMVAAIPAKAQAAQKNQITGLPTKSVKCGAKHPREQTFKAAQIKTAAEQALDLVDDGKQLGAQNYPHRYGYRDPTVKLSSQCKSGDNLQEFPIMRGKYTGGDVATVPDRIVIKIKGKNKAVYCGLMTHEGAPPAPGVAGPFTSCSG